MDFHTRVKISVCLFNCCFVNADKPECKNSTKENRLIVRNTARFVCVIADLCFESGDGIQSESVARSVQWPF